ncbi:outer membrane protein insertion porin family [Marinitoga hydrogenitolerans DSM 16785]|uniref:Outer membrane protein insertion porin family n=1 Tax=Marinitoga hydrogenitolerans (strain DSM 16785 / JCM 12826 / AT1271) TaxID=1122195 RepID=A0A1M4Z796_MARH1|nr:POTRA domain-containing protein [Marinitoga hydrogenitolerans]SHF13891.1 outer membrane protein insertion porin family [Marinitoga hydrogenitolerans DSM 16785]
MKKVFLVIILIGLFINIFALMNVKNVVFEGNVSFVEQELKDVLSKYDIKDNSVVGEIDIKLAIEAIQKKYPYFSSISYNYSEEKNELKFIFKLNPIVRNVEFKILGDKLLDLSNIATKVYTEVEKPLNINEYKKGLEEIKKYYNENGYIYIEVFSNIKLNSEGLSLEATQVDSKKISGSNTLVYVIKEYDLWDVELNGEIKKLDKEELKKLFGFDFRKDWENKFFLFRPDVKDTYPKVEDIQKIFQSLQQLPYFSKNTQISIKPLNIEKTPGGDLVIVLDGELKKIIDKPVIINKVNIIGNNKVKNFEIIDKLRQDNISENASISNIDILNSIKGLKDYYNNLGYPFVDINVDYKSNVLTYSITEYKVGDVLVEFNPEQKTKNYLVKPAIKLKSDNVITTKDIQDTYYALSGTGFFEKVNIYPYSQKKDKIDFKVDITEKNKPGKFIGGLTYTVPENAPWYMGFLGQVELQWANPWGYGQSFNISSNINPLSETYIFNGGYGVKNLFGTKFSFNTKLSYGLYNENEGIPQENISGIATVSNKVSFSVSPNYNIDDFNNINMNFSYSETKYNPNTYPLNKQFSSGIGYTYSRLDYPFRPYNGMYNTLQLFGGFNTLNTSEYYYGGYLENKIFKTYYKFTFANRFKTGYVKDDFGLYDFYLGGMYTIRGYDFSIRTGNMMILNNTEIQYQINKENVPVDLYAFFDIGNSNNDNLMNNYLWSYGIGVKLTIPMIGPIRFEGVFDTNNKFKWTFGFGPVF